MRGRNGSNALLRIYFCVFYGYDCTYSGLAHEAIFHTPIYHFYPYGCDGGGLCGLAFITTMETFYIV